MEENEVMCKCGVNIIFDYEEECFDCWVALEAEEKRSHDTQYESEDY